MTAAVGGGMEEVVGKERKPEHICAAAGASVLLPCDPEHDGKTTENRLALGFG